MEMPITQEENIHTIIENTGDILDNDIPIDTDFNLTNVVSDLELSAQESHYQTPSVNMNVMSNTATDLSEYSSEFHNINNMNVRSDTASNLSEYSSEFHNIDNNNLGIMSDSEIHKKSSNLERVIYLKSLYPELFSDYTTEQLTQTMLPYISLYNKLNKHDGLKIAHLNVRSLLPKVEDIRLLLHIADLDILCTNETWLDDSVFNSEIHWIQCNSHFADCKQRVT